MAGPKKPLVALRIDPDREMREAILEGRRRIQICVGYSDFRPHPIVMLCAQVEPWCVMADISDHRHCLLSEVTEEEWRANGFESREELLTGMQRSCPTMMWDSAVTIVWWDNVRGKLVDDWAKLRESSWVLQDS